MEECKVGEYGRTNLGKIFIFAWLEYAVGKRDESKVLLGDGKTFENRFYYFKEGEKILKHSRNPIDLIEVDDIVEVLDNAVGFKAKIHIYDNLLLETVKEDIQNKNYELIGIATHELFESIKYEV